MIKPGRTSVRRVGSKGARIVTTGIPEQPISPDGRPQKTPLTYEDLARYAKAAERRLGEYKALLEQVFVLVDESLADVPTKQRTRADPRVRAWEAIASFDRQLPSPGKPRTAKSRAKPAKELMNAIDTDDEESS